MFSYSFNFNNINSLRTLSISKVSALKVNSKMIAGSLCRGVQECLKPATALCAQIKYSLSLHSDAACSCTSGEENTVTCLVVTKELVSRDTKSRFVSAVTCASSWVGENQALRGSLVANEIRRGKTAHKESDRSEGRSSDRG
jgi:hypothetical protein